MKQNSMMVTTIVPGLLFIAFLQSVHFWNVALSHKAFQDYIPNGDHVQHPCLTNYMWQGVGHYNKAGGGPRNPFGVDFKANGLNWTPELCTMDSDGDGMTNGQELGDPDCVWSQGKIPSRTTGITHPGVCEPVSSPTCQGKNAAFGNFCAKPELVCDGLNDSDTETITFHFNRTLIPPKVTNYFCQAFEIPEDKYMFAMEAQIDNEAVMHHIVVFGCASKPSDSIFSEPISCGMAGNGCSDIISLWSVGIAGDCYGQNTYVPLGPTGYPYVMVQFHWNNYNSRSDQYDSSGIKFFLKPNPRQFEAGIIIAGSIFLDLDPGQSLVYQNNTWPSECSKMLVHPTGIHVIDALLHMHYTGVSGNVLQYRNNSFVRNIVPQGSINYDSPTFHKLDANSTFLPGDSLSISCQYKTLNKDYKIFFGEGTDDEMCYAFIRYFPKASLYRQQIVNFGRMELCKLAMPQFGGINMKPGIYENCNMTHFIKDFIMGTDLMQRISEYCKPELTDCHHKCMLAVQDMNKHSCMQGLAYKFNTWSTTFSYNAYQTEMATLLTKTNVCQMQIRFSSPPTNVKNTTGSTTVSSFPMDDIEHAKLIIVIVACVAGGLFFLGMVILATILIVKYVKSSSKPSNYLVKSEGAVINEAYSPAKY